MKGNLLDLNRAAVKDDPFRVSNDYTDKCDAVPIALAALLVMFVEDEHGGASEFQKRIDERINPPADLKLFDEACNDPDMKIAEQAWIAAEIKILQLYRWWTETRPELMRREEKLLRAWSKSKNLDRGIANLNTPDTAKSKRLFEAHGDLQDRIRAEMQLFCLGVIEVREYLWT